MEENSDSDLIMIHDVGDSYINNNHIDIKTNESSKKKRREKR
jgi:hypothetical protein